jgi:hypothetical protein
MIHVFRVRIFLIKPEKALLSVLIPSRQREQQVSMVVYVI